MLFHRTSMDSFFDGIAIHHWGRNYETYSSHRVGIHFITETLETFDIRYDSSWIRWIGTFYFGLVPKSFLAPKTTSITTAAVVVVNIIQQPFLYSTRIFHGM
jgi:hypothetical protein